MKFRSKLDITVLDQALQRINKQAKISHFKGTFHTYCLYKSFRWILNTGRFGSMSQRC